MLKMLDPLREINFYSVALYIRANLKSVIHSCSCFMKKT